jgi:hypothetical protein
VDEEKGIAMLTLREFIGPAPTIRVGGLSVTDQQIIAQHPSGATKVFDAGQFGGGMSRISCEIATDGEGATVRRECRTLLVKPRHKDRIYRGAVAGVNSRRPFEPTE